MKIILILLLLVSCKNRERNTPIPMAPKSCSESVKGEYQSYFDSVEKCIESEADIQKQKIQQIK